MIFYLVNSFFVLPAKILSTNICANHVENALTLYIFVTSSVSFAIFNSVPSSFTPHPLLLITTLLAISCKILLVYALLTCKHNRNMN